ncbi:hypothetical protein HPB50_007059 [Hyalomma asiaticum]|uniref:Uncharacterized protein n=1 Tax=Hyalomma asiaticum TaxID=266040 RepID=A0ACB7SL62_HYAAI|nr:hypothetical protein HPB50_007059 [Hyalomma asiaticum]
MAAKLVVSDIDELQPEDAIFDGEECDDQRHGRTSRRWSPAETPPPPFAGAFRRRRYPVDLSGAASVSCVLVTGDPQFACLSCSRRLSEASSGFFEGVAERRSSCGRSNR